MKRGGVPFMPRKPLDALEGLTLASAGQVSFLTPVRMPHGEWGAWGRAPEGVPNRELTPGRRHPPA